MRILPLFSGGKVNLFFIWSREKLLFPQVKVETSGLANGGEPFALYLWMFA
jgi:hypothetical protein